MAHMTEISKKVKADSERLTEQARALRQVQALAAVAAQAASSPKQQQQHHHHVPSSSPVQQPDFSQGGAAGQQAGGSPGTVYTRATYQTFDDGASIYTTATLPAAAAAARSQAVQDYNAYAAAQQAAAQQPVPAEPAAPAAANGGATASGGVALSAPPPPRALMSTQAPGELFEPEVMSLFDKHKRPVAGLWQFYTAMSRGSDGTHNTPAVGLDAKRFIELYLDYDIAPTFLTKKELKQIFIASSKAHGGTTNAAAGSSTTDEAASATPLTYAAFVEALGRTALVALSKPAFQTLYPSARDKVAVLLEMWGVADPRKLKEVQDKIKGASAASVAAKSTRTAGTAATPGKSRSRKSVAGVGAGSIRL